ncbi:MAG: DUF2141 domain-containing protein [Owenweeksia sp.]|nr:DUF2141 domain-containing protein [Owenweeksia sp.]
MKIFLSLLFIISHMFGSAQNKHSLDVVFTNIQSTEGHILFQVVDEKNQVVAAHQVPPTIGKTIYKVALPTGNYTIKAYHDLNNNEELDRNTLGIPQEPYGFSNNARGTFRPASHGRPIFT